MADGYRAASFLSRSSNKGKRVERLTLGKDEKLRHKTLVDALFAEGKSLYDFPLRLTYRILDDAGLRASFRREPPERIGPMQMLITVPKKKLRRAVDRVRMRRLIREAYRLNRKGLKLEAAGNPDVRTVSMAFVYLGNEKTDYATVEKKMKRLLGKIELPEGAKETDGPEDRRDKDS